MPGFADDVRDMLVLESGRVGEGSREASGEGAADDEVEVPEVCDANLEGHKSVLGVIVTVLDVDSRERVAYGAKEALLGDSEREPSGEPFAAPGNGELSIFAMQPRIRGRRRFEE